MLTCCWKPRVVTGVDGIAVGGGCADFFERHHDRADPGSMHQVRLILPLGGSPKAGPSVP